MEAFRSFRVGSRIQKVIKLKDLFVSFKSAKGKGNMYMPLKGADYYCVR